MTAPARIPFLRLTGDPSELGRAHGAARAATLQAFLDDGLCRLNRILDKPLSMESLRPTIEAYDAEISAAAPLLSQEIGGLAEGAGITREQGVLLQIRREVLGYQKIPTMGDCTTYARPGPNAVLAQTIDLNGDLDDQIAVIELERTGSPRRVLIVSFHGLLGYLGVNSDGLAIGLNLLLGGDWRPGIPPYLAIRHLLDSAADVHEALAVLRGLRLASSRSLTLCDGSTSAYVEILGDELRVVEAPESTHTNHYLHPDFVSSDQLNIFARNSSALRLQACRAGLEALPADAGPEEHFALLAPPPIYVGNTGDIRRERTLATVVMLPGPGEMHVRTDDASLRAGVRPNLTAGPSAALRETSGARL
jgi:isopenicillin-N N-acyltransferase like protein